MLRMVASALRDTFALASLSSSLLAAYLKPNPGLQAHRTSCSGHVISGMKDPVNGLSTAPQAKVIFTRASALKNSFIARFIGHTSGDLDWNVAEEEFTTEEGRSPTNPP
ncbi:hypothetical protein MRX96_001802 [Rhipicephalus microplus]